MFKKIALASALSLAVLSNAALCEEAKAEAAKAQSSASKISVAVVNIRLIMSELPQAKEATIALQKEFGPRSEELRKIQEEGQKLEKELQTAKGERVTEINRKLAQMKADFELKSQALQEDSQKKEREIEVKLGRLVQTAIDRIAKERGIDLVVRGEAVVFATPAVDISEDVIARASKLKSSKEVNKK